MKLDNEFKNLVQNYIVGRITEGELEQLNVRLTLDSESRRYFNELLNLDSALAEVAAGQISDDEQPGEQLTDSLATDCQECSASYSTFDSKSGSRQFFSAGRMLVVVASLILLVSGTWWWQTHPRVFATISSAAGVEGPTEGTVLRNEVIVIEKGSLELVTKNGARIAIEAPAEFRFESAQRLHMKRGRLAADVPPSAKGFTVVTPTGEAVDLGTKFGVDIPSQGNAEIHVFEGEVIAQSSGGGKRLSLRDGEAFKLQAGAGRSRALRSSAFIRPGEVASLRAALDEGQHAKSNQFLDALRKDPALIALLDFETENLPAGTYRMTQGRWPGSHAPEFVNVGDHMKLNVGGEQAWPQLTLAAWVRIDQLGEPYQSFLHTDGWGEQDGQVHWMVTHHTTMRLALYGNTLDPGSKNVDKYPDSLTPVLPQQGRWVHLAVVYDSVGGRVRFFFNGKLDKEERLDVAHPARLGPGQIGNWDLRDRKLSGRMDELLILGRAMDDEQVHALFKVGTPYR
ncbi:LamG-like jellyroll fold domain-containing protein [uncultured Gimesia sp.]|uniref:LamG-like jellyroll fold domain-containing protein n=1 Tax=uncultured Gimesia sp. TaxID=1678688 RepID=UPI00260BADF2|nr:LamG-like jellyroll fold domain-containing protein [uncultured Gimesia sp.]